ncbi:MAG: TIGR04282 family arsenosugar biosynthesis glycosyltransferase [Planctomycetota bacterium]
MTEPSPPDAPAQPDATAALRPDLRVDVVIPAFNEENAIGKVLDEVPQWVRRVVVADNASTDATAQVAQQHGAVVVHEPQRGYGVACLTALRRVAGHPEGPPDVIVFLDGDYSDYPEQMSRLIEPITRDRADLVIGSRVLGRAERGALNAVQRFGNGLSTTLLRLLFGVRFSDLGPFRAIGWRALQTLEMDDRDWGWTVQMQARAAALGLRCAEAPVDYRRRIGQSKISGTVRGVFAAGTKILTTIAREFFRARAVRKRGWTLLVFSRVPEAGRTKTRMIPALGAQGAADLQRELTRFVLDRVAPLQPETWLAGPKAASSDAIPDLGRAAFGPGRYRAQPEGDLGQKLAFAVEEAFAEGARRVAVVGGDCPDLSTALVRSGLLALDDADVALGPAEDGGYYLIAMKRPHPELFRDIDWGGPEVFAQTRSSAEQAGLTVHTLETGRDVDTPDDLAHWDALRAAQVAQSTG